MTLNKAAFPDWTAYVVVAYGAELAAPCSSIEKAVECMTREAIAFTCQVFRFADETIIWPIYVKGGEA